MSAVNPFAANFAKEAFEKFRDTPSTESCDKKIADEWGELMREYFEKVPDKYSETIHFAEPSPPLFVHVGRKCRRTLHRRIPHRD
jgi:hypothetical protein